jgi:hypothetical protein
VHVSPEVPSAVQVLVRVRVGVGVGVGVRLRLRLRLRLRRGTMGRELVRSAKCEEE